MQRVATVATPMATRRRSAGPDQGPDALLRARAHPLGDVIQALRALLRETEPGLEEHVKWNAPSYRHQGEDRITFQLRDDDRVRLVFHCGSKPSDRGRTQRLVDDPAGLLEWAAPDRGIASFRSLAEVRQHASALAALVRRWLSVSP